jgi:hypothetical protein
MRALISSSVDGEYISQQCVQSLRASRCASTADTRDPVRNGSTPISFRRVSAPGASFVCSVESTRWPVRAASIAILAVSPSRISPTITTSGSERRIDRSAVANVSPARWVDLHLVDSREPELDRILDRDDVDLGTVDLRQRRVERRRLTGAGRARARIAPVGLRMISSSFARMSSLSPRSASVGAFFDLSRRRITIDSPSTVGRVATRMSSSAGGGGIQRDAAVLRLAALGDVELREHLQARGHPGHHPLRDALHLVQHAVDAEPDDERVLLRLEVHVAAPRPRPPGR